MLSDREQLVLHTMRMRLSTLEALAYLKANNNEMTERNYFYIKKKLEERKLHRLYEIAKIGFVDQHLERIDQLELIQKLMWQNFHLEQDPYKKNRILKDIAEIQPYLSAYYEATKWVMENKEDRKTNRIPDPPELIGEEGEEATAAGQQ